MSDSTHSASVKASNQTSPRTQFTFPAHLKFAFDDIQDAEFGTASGLVGQIPFLCPPQKLVDRVAHVDAKPAEVKELVYDILSKHRDTLPVDFDILAKQKDAYDVCRPILIAHGISFGAHQKTERNFFAELYVVFTAADSLLDSTIGTHEFVGPEFEQLVEACVGFRSSLTAPKAQLPSGSSVSRLVKMLPQMHSGYIDAVPDFESKYPTLLGPAMARVLFGHLLYHMELSGGVEEPKYSKVTMAELWDPIGIWIYSLHSFLALHGVELSRTVRKSELFGICVRRAGDIMVLLNALFGLHRDVRLKQTDSPITHAVRMDGARLQDAWDSALRRIHDCYKDYRITTQRMMAVFKSEEDEVARFVQLTDTYIDGCLFMYTLSKRYGHTHQNAII